MDERMRTIPGDKFFQAPARAGEACAGTGRSGGEGSKGRVWY